MGFQILNHTADLRLKVFAKDKGTLFKEALKGMMSILKKNIQERKETEKTIEIKSFDLNSLLIDFLNEVLYLTQSEKSVFSFIEFENFTNSSLKARLFGYKIDGFDKDIKAATYHKAEIKKENNKLTAAIIFDI